MVGRLLDVDHTQNIISFCTGYGGIELGLRRAGVDVRVVCNVEIEAFVQANLVAKIEEGRMDDAPIWTDLKTFPASIFRGKICGLIGGYPCQPFSSAGKRKGEDDPRHLWPYIRKHIRAIRPLWCFFENVRGHTTMGLWRVLSDLEEEGYETEWGLFSAEETGAPHQRIRCFILAKLPHTCGKGLQGDKLGGSCDEQVEGLQGTHESTSELHQVRHQQFPNSGNAKGYSTIEGCIRQSLGNPTGERPRGGRENCEGEQSEVPGAGLESDELAHPNCDEQTEKRGDNGEVLEVSQVEGQELSPTLLGGESTQGGELAHTASREPRQSQARNGGQDTGGGSEEELGDTCIERCEQDSALRDKQQASGVEQIGGNRGSEEELVNPVGGRFKQRESECEKEDFVGEGGQQTRWPARPGEEQYEWEEPRVVADCKVKRCGGRKDKDGENREGLSEQEGEERSILRSKTEGCSGDGETTLNEAQSELGGAVDGSACGVDPIANRVDRLRLLGNGVVSQTAELAWKTLWKKMN